MNNDRPVRVLRLIAVLLTLALAAAFFLPYISATPEYAERLDRLGDDSLYQSVTLRPQDMKHLSLLKYAQVYFLGGEEVLNNRSAGIFYGALISLIGLLSLLCLLCSLKGKPVALLILDIVLLGVFYLVRWDFIDRGIMPSANRQWGVAYSLYWAAGGLLLPAAVGLLIAKKRAKKCAAS